MTRAVCVHLEHDDEPQKNVKVFLISEVQTNNKKRVLKFKSNTTFMFREFRSWQENLFCMPS